MQSALERMLSESAVKALAAAQLDSSEPRLFLALSQTEAIYVQGRFPDPSAVAQVLQAHVDTHGVWVLAEWPGGVVTHHEGALVYAVAPLREVEARATLVTSAQSSLDAGKELAETSVVSVTNRLTSVRENVALTAQGLRTLADTYGEGSGLVEAVGNLIATLRRVRNILVDDLHQQNALVQEAIESVQGIGRVTAIIGDFAEAVRMATFNARIEGARVGAAGAGFLAIANSLADMGRALKSANQEAGGIVTRLGRSLPRLRGSTDTITGRVEEQLDDLVKSVSTVRTQLEENRGNADAALAAASESAGQVGKLCDAAMGDLQFQDRVSQLLEASSKALRAFTEGVDDAALKSYQDKVYELLHAASAADASAQGGSIELF